MNKQFPRRTERRILVIDAGCMHVKVLVTGLKEPIKIFVGPTLTAKAMVRQIQAARKTSGTT
jgi:hypothetical protein